MDAWSCKFCETVNGANDATCIGCERSRAEAGRPVRAAAPTAAEARASAATAAGASSSRIGAGNEVPSGIGAPAPATAPPAPPAGGDRRGWVPYAVAAAIVLALVAGALALRPKGDTGPSTDESASSYDIGSSSGSGSTDGDVVVDDTEPPTTTPPTTTIPVGSVPSGSWVLILRSVPQNEPIATATAERDSVASGTSIPVVVLDSNDYPSLNGGYWAVAAGPFASREEARSSCGALGRELGGGCYDRQL